MQKEILEKYPDSKLQVYAVWFNMVGSDSKSAWPSDLLPDPRVVHWWDEQKIAGSWYARQPDYAQYGDVLWDAFLLYSADAEWGEKPSNPVAVGRTIIEDRKDLKLELERLLKETP